MPLFLSNYMLNPSASSVLLLKYILDESLAQPSPLTPSQAHHQLLPGQTPQCSPTGLLAFCFPTSPFKWKQNYAILQ